MFVDGIGPPLEQIREDYPNRKWQPASDVHALIDEVYRLRDAIDRELALKSTYDGAGNPKGGHMTTELSPTKDVSDQWIRHALRLAENNEREAVALERRAAELRAKAKEFRAMVPA